MKTVRSVIAAAVEGTAGFGASATHAPDEGTRFSKVSAHQQDQGTPPNLIG